MRAWGSRALKRVVLAASRYAPLGTRGISGGRTTGFGTLALPTYFARANSEIMVVAMIEDREGVDNLDAILSVAGIDMVLEGTIDLSQFYGVPGQAQHPIVQDAIERLRRAAGVAVSRIAPFRVSQSRRPRGKRATCRRIYWATTAARAPARSRLTWRHSDDDGTRHKAHRSCRDISPGEAVALRWFAGP